MYRVRVNRSRRERARLGRIEGKKRLMKMGGQRAAKEDRIGVRGGNYKGKGKGKGMQEGRISWLQTWQGQSGKQAELPRLEGGGGGFLPAGTFRIHA